MKGSASAIKWAIDFLSEELQPLPEAIGEVQTLYFYISPYSAKWLMTEGTAFRAFFELQFAASIRFVNPSVLPVSGNPLPSDVTPIFTPTLTCHVIQQDIRDVEDVEGIICPSGCEMQHIGGLAAKLLERDPGLQSRTNTIRGRRKFGVGISEYVQTNVPVWAMFPLFTGRAGTLHAKGIIFTVTPDNDDKPDLETTITQCVRSSLHQAAFNGCHSIAMPCLGSGGHENPVSVCASIIVKSMFTWFNENPNSPITKVYLCDVSREPVQAFDDALRNVTLPPNVQISLSTNETLSPPIPTPTRTHTLTPKPTLLMVQCKNTHMDKIQSKLRNHREQIFVNRIRVSPFLQSVGEVASSHNVSCSFKEFNANQHEQVEANNQQSSLTTNPNVIHTHITKTELDENANFLIELEGLSMQVQAATKSVLTQIQARDFGVFPETWDLTTDDLLVDVDMRY